MIQRVGLIMVENSMFLVAKASKVISKQELGDLLVSASTCIW